MRAAPLADRAARLHAAALASSDDGRPASAVRQLRAGLRLIGTAADSGDPAVAEIRGRLLISLAWAESERGRVDVGFRLLDQAEQHITLAQRPVLLAQRGLLLKRSGRNDLALRQYDEAEALLTETSPLDLVKVLNNRSLVHLEAGHIRLARADLHRCGQVAARHGLALHAALSRVNLGCMDVVAGDLPSALGAFAAARADYELLAPGRLASLAVERARALVTAGLFTEADRELAYAAEQAAAQRLSHTYADAAAVRAEAALLAGRAAAAAQWARDARARFLGRDNARRAALSSLLELRADLATAAKPADAIAARGQSLARRLSLLGLPEDARVASLVAARALIRAGRPAGATRAAARYGPPGRVNRLDTRLLWRLARSELASAASSRPRPPGTCWPGWPRCTGTAPSSAALTCRPARPCTGRTWPAPGWRRHSPAARRTPCTGGRNAPGPRHFCCPPQDPGQPGGCGGPGGTAPGPARAARAGAGRTAGRRPARPRRGAAAQYPRAVVDGTGAARCRGPRARPAPRDPGQPGRGRARHVPPGRARAAGTGRGG